MKIRKHPRKKADKLAAKHNKQYGVYRCPYCSAYHLTTKLENEHLYEPLIYTTK